MKLAFDRGQPLLRLLAECLVVGFTAGVLAALFFGALGALV